MLSISHIISFLINGNRNWLMGHRKINSPTGLGSILIQDSRAIAFASRSLSDVESRYSQTEREALGVVWACGHFDQSLQGDPQFTIITDHEPLLTIWKKARPPLRIERWGLRLRSGNKNPTDYMSRNPITMVGTRRHQKWLMIT